MVTKLSITLTLASAFFSTQHDVTLAFTPSPSSTPALRTSSTTELYMSSFFADATEPKEITEAKVEVDASGKAFSPGAVVAIAPTRSMKAYQVPKSSYGSFDSTSREFIPQDKSNITRGTRCLVLPEGLRGEVQKIFASNEGLDRSHPIVVKFEAGEDREGGEGFNVPKKFLMHFDADEIVLV
mmetsp:Transcript_25304/g.54458  ORF Transcript_25304/g.54458 Transcript_25304/m.54458 type:complete len:183 (-) Transcript_25304:212-760(-)|eukprot:CAMPEP_0172298812 /NCGR_PEP_ID=MMETSP1058-20130122/1294_1 /TAXON_ID=83371 /ORGANISM="Detonula confervacea, Strain CCMP 353" /LENGTH=182 /DNA_ID=CAMNT_0013008105 /DNA_START=113 /DNA_END=661 /DNA_ORIENTATION=-